MARPTLIMGTAFLRDAYSNNIYQRLCGDDTIIVVARFTPAAAINRLVHVSRHRAVVVVTLGALDRNGRK